MRFVQARDDWLHGFMDHSSNPIAAWSGATERMDETEEFYDLWEDEDERALLSGYFLFLGTEYLLKGKKTMIIRWLLPTHLVRYVRYLNSVIVGHREQMRYTK